MALLSSFTSDRLKVRIFESRAEMGACVASDAAACLRSLLHEKSEVNIIFAAAPSQNETLAALVQAPGIDWTRVNAFHMDEYVGLNADAPQCFGRYLYDHIFSVVPFKSINYIDGNADTASECERYAKLLKNHPIDIVMLGIGENGHIAFNDPDEADFDDPEVIKPVCLDEICRNQQVNDGCFERIEDVPKQALTLTIPTLFRGMHLFCSVPASTKERAVTLTVRGEISERVPATIMRRHRDATLYADSDSGRGLLL